MSKTTRRRPTPPPSPRYTKTRGIGTDRVFWPTVSSRLPYQELPNTPPATEVEEAEAGG